MDEDFEYFLEKMGPAFDKRTVPAAAISRYKGKVPEQLLAYWQDHGWSGYADGLFWTVDPQEYEPVLEAWIGTTPFMERDAYHVIARGAFGDLYLWGENTGSSLTISAQGSFCVARSSTALRSKLDLAVRVFFSNRSREENDFGDLFDPALKKLGVLSHDEMYGFVPALALGGPSTLKHLQKVSAVEHLVFLAQLAPLRVMEVPQI